jgi:amino acid adenylation domain-containing protein
MRPAMSEARFLHEYLLGSSTDPAAPAIRDLTGQRVRTYGQLAADARILASELDRLGVVTGDRVLLRLRPGIEAVSAILACSMRGAVFVPVDPDAPEDRIQAIAKIAEPALEVTAGDDAGSTVNRVGDSGHPRSQLETDLAYIIFTSGTTGSPKGICLSHRAVLAFYRGMNATCPVPSTARLGSVSPLHFDLSLLDLGQALGCGASIVHLDRRLVRSPRRFVSALATGEVSQLNCVPSVWRILLRHVPDLLQELSGLRTTLFAGEAFPVSELRQLQGLMPKLEMVNCFGQSESIASSFLRLPRPLPEVPSAPIGPAHVGADFLVLGPSGEPVRVGETGEIYLRGPSLFSGYWNDPRATSLALVPNPLDSGSPERVFRTGDLVRKGADGEFFYVGRHDLQVQILGNRVEPEEIERCIGGCAGVSEVAVYADDSGANVRLIAVVAGDRGITPPSIREFCASRLPDYMIPAEIRLVDALPRNASGKLDRQHLRFARQPPAPGR